MKNSRTRRGEECLVDNERQTTQRQQQQEHNSSATTTTTTTKSCNSHGLVVSSGVSRLVRRISISSFVRQDTHGWLFLLAIRAEWFAEPRPLSLFLLPRSLGRFSRQDLFAACFLFGPHILAGDEAGRERLTCLRASKKELESRSLGRATCCHSALTQSSRSNVQTLLTWRIHSLAALPFPGPPLRPTGVALNLCGA